MPSLRRVTSARLPAFPRILTSTRGPRMAEGLSFYVHSVALYAAYKQMYSTAIALKFHGGRATRKEIFWKAPSQTIRTRRSATSALDMSSRQRRPTKPGASKARRALLPHPAPATLSSPHTWQCPSQLRSAHAGSPAMCGELFTLTAHTYIPGLPSWPLTRQPSGLVMSCWTPATVPDIIFIHCIFQSVTRKNVLKPKLII